MVLIKGKLKKTIKVNFLVVLIITIVTLFMLYAYSNYNYLWGTPSPLLTLNAEKVFRMFLYTWDDSYNLGGSRVSDHSYILIAPLFIILNKILEPKLTYLLYKYLIIIIAGISMFYFSKLIFKEFNDIQIFSYISAFLYMFNPQTAEWASSNIDLMLPYAITPAILYFLLKSVLVRRFLNIFLAAVILSIAFLHNIGSIFVMLTLIMLFIFLYSLLTKEAKLIKNSFLALSISILFISWHTLPAIYSFLNEVEAWKSIGMMERFYSLRANTINSFTLINQWELFTSYEGYKIFYFSEIYKNFGILLLLVPIITFISLLFLRKIHNRHLVITLSLICIIGILFAQGTNSSSPFSQSYRILLENVPLFYSVRNSTKFNHLIVFSYSLSFPYSTFILYRIFDKQEKILKYTGKKSVILLCIIVLSVCSAPFWSGKLFNNYMSGIPKEVILVSEYINNENEDGAVLILPGPWLYSYEWLHPYIPFPIYLSTIKERNPIIFRYGGDMPLNINTYNFLEEFYKNFFSFQNTKILKLLRVKYILVDETIDTSFYKNNIYPTADITKIEDYLQKREDIKIVKKFGKIRLYEYEEKIMPEIYISTIYTYNMSDVEIKGYTKINPTLWRVNVNATKPFMLSFSQSYSSLWEARVYKDGELIEIVKPTLLYDVICGFWIDEIGNLEIVIRYKPQDWYECGLIISSLTFAFCLFYLFYNWKKEQKFYIKKLFLQKANIRK